MTMRTRTTVDHHLAGLELRIAMRKFCNAAAHYEHCAEGQPWPQGMKPPHKLLEQMQGHLTDLAAEICLGTLPPAATEEESS